MSQLGNDLLTRLAASGNGNSRTTKPPYLPEVGLNAASQRAGKGSSADGDQLERSPYELDGNQLFAPRLNRGASGSDR